MQVMFCLEKCTHYNEIITKLKFSLPHSSLFINVTQPCVTF